MDLFQLGWFANPIFSMRGNYPATMITQIASNSVREGRSWSRLPTFSEQWINIIKGSADFLGLNYYSSRYIDIAETPVGENPSYERDMNLKYYVKDDWKRAASSWLYSVPQGLGDILRCVFLPMKTYYSQ